MAFGNIGIKCSACFMMIRFVIPLLLLCVSVYGTEYHPWFGKDKLIEVDTVFSYRYYPHVDVNGTTRPRYSNDYFGNFAARVSPTPAWSFEVEIDTASTRSTCYSLDSTLYTGRYLILDDVIGDLISLAAGITVSQATTSGLRDISTFHNGQMEYEFHLAFGKESSCRQFWTSRFWGLTGCGIANRGSPWLKVILGYDKNCWDWHHYGIYLQGLYGFGQQDLNLFERFKGYGFVKYRALDITAYYTYSTDALGSATFAYTLRPWAHNFPTHAHALTVRVTIPINPTSIL